MPLGGPDIFRRPEENDREDEIKEEKEKEKKRNQNIIDEQQEDPACAGRGGARRTQKKEMIEGRMELQFLERKDLEIFLRMLLAEEEKRKNADQRDALRSIFDERIETKLGVLRVSFLGGIANERKAHVERILEATEWTGDKKKGIDGLFELYLKAERDATRGPKGKKPEEMEKLLFGGMKIEDLTKGEREMIMQTLMGEVALYKMLLDDAILRSAVDDEDTYKRITELARTLDRKSDSLMILRKIESVIVENAQKEQNIALTKLIELGTLASSILHGEPKEEVKRQKEVIHEKKEDDMPLSAKLLESVSSLTEIGKNTVKTLMDRGMSDVAVTVLSSPSARSTSNGLAADMAGGTLKIETGENTVRAVWESEDGQKIPINLSLEPLPTALDQARSLAINVTTEVRMLQTQKQLNEKIVRKLGGINLSDETLMSTEEANDWKRVLRVLFGKNTPAEAERRILQELSILKETGEFDPVRTAWLRLYLKYRKAKDGLPSITFDQLAQITRQWEAERAFSVEVR